MALEMIKDKIAVIPIEDPDMIGSLYVPEKGKQRVDQGIVKYRGPDCKEIRVGMHVIFSGYTGTHVAIEDEGMLIIMFETDVVALMNDNEAESAFPLRRILELVGTIEDELTLMYKGKAVVPTIFSERLKTRFREHFYAEGLEF